MRTTFPEPTSYHEATVRLAALKQGVKEVTAALKDKHLRFPETGRRMTTAEYFEWKLTARRSLMEKEREIAFLRAWVNENKSVGVQHHQAQSSLDQSMLSECRTALLRLDMKGLLQEQERVLLRQLEHRLGVGLDPLIQKARSCMTGNPHNIFSYGSMIVRATRDQEDLDALRRQWESVSGGAYDPVVKARCAREHVRALLAMGATDEARGILESCDESVIDTAYAWLWFAEETEDADALERVRVLAASRADSRDAMLWILTYRVSGEAADALQANRMVRDHKNPPLFLMVLGQAYAWHGRVEEAQAILRGLDDERALELSCTIALETRDEADRTRAISVLERHVPEKQRTIREVLRVLASHGETDLALRTVKDLKSQTDRCFAFGRLSWEIDDLDLRKKFLVKADELTVNLVDKSSAGAMALLNVSVGHAMLDNIARAAQIAETIRDRECRCRAFLISYEITRDGMSRIVEDI
ncbi:hypothetical protein EPO33_00320 [Patescibacteria group bacterium]|nr:MAG: hypothetical protein EPO33_00320 [Patescibacteria group bacterium]